MTIGQWIRTRQEELKISQAELWKRADVIDSSLSRWRNDKMRINEECMRKLESVLGPCDPETRKAVIEKHVQQDRWKNKKQEHERMDREYVPSMMTDRKVISEWCRYDCHICDMQAKCNYGK